MALIKINDALIVDSSEITKAGRCGNYTDVWLRCYNGSTLMQIWDEHKTLWTAIENAVISP